MKKIKKDFTEIWKEITDKCRKQYGIDVGNNATFVAETIFKESRKKNIFAYVECGVYKGTTFFPIYHLCETLFEDFTLYPLDSFSGFPKNSFSVNDEFDKFEILFREGKISKDHLDRAKERCSKLSKREHLQKDYFKNYSEEFFSRCRRKKNINIIKCSFSDLETNFTGSRDKYDLIFLDCDLYLSYRYCLGFFKNKTDIFIFDEYYSLKYPGPRIACDEFIEGNLDWKFFKKIETNPYFERWGIRRISKQG